MDLEKFLLELKEFGLDVIVRNYRLAICRDPPLLILNYQRQKTVPFCRGLCLAEVDGKFTVVAPSLYQYQETSEIDWKQVDHIQTKEDGTLMILYWHDSWRVNCRFNFGDDDLPEGPQTYSEMFWKLLSINKVLQRDKVYYFEMCTRANRIIQPYDSDRLFLLGGYHKDLKQYFSIEETNVCATQFEVWRPKQFSIQGRAQLQEALRQLPPTTEGFLVYYTDGTMIKYKQPFYKLLNQLKYRDYVFLTPKWARLLASLPGYVDTVTALGVNMLELQKRMLEKTSSDHNMLACLDQAHSCVHDDGLAQSPYQSTLGKWVVMCPCTSRMELRKLRRDWVRPRPCYCGVLLKSVYKVSVNRYLYICPTCENTHECTPHFPFAPLGIPCSFHSKIYRLHFHDLFDRLSSQPRPLCPDKSSAYMWIADLLQLPSEKVHAANMGISTCKKAIHYLAIITSLTNLCSMSLVNIILHYHTN